MKKTYFVKSHTIAGTRSAINGVPNQDNITIFEDDKILLACVSDGCTNAEFAVEASKMNGQVAIKASKLIWTKDEKKARHYLCECYNEIFSNSDFAYRQLCATTAFVMINKQTGAYRAFSVGDTAILSYDANGQFKIFLEPVNAFRKSSTYFTNDNLSVKKFSQFRQGTVDGIAGFVIYSDGAENISEKPYADIRKLVSSAYVSEKTYNNEQEDIFEKLKSITDDDISIAILGISDDKIAEKMKEYYSSINNATEDEEETIQEEKVTEINDFVPDNPEKKENSLVAFLYTPRTIEEIICSDLVRKEDIVSVLVEMMRDGIVNCTAGKFCSR